MNAIIEESADFALGARLRGEMAAELGNDWTADNPDWLALYARYFGDRAAKGEAQLFIARIDGEPAGMAIVSIMEHYRRLLFGTKYAYVNGVYVRAPFRRRGIGSELMERVEDWARDNGCIALRLRASEEGSLLYASLGYVHGHEMEKPLR